MAGKIPLTFSFQTPYLYNATLWHYINANIEARKMHLKMSSSGNQRVEISDRILKNFLIKCVMRVMKGNIRYWLGSGTTSEALVLPMSRR